MSQGTDNRPMQQNTQEVAKCRMIDGMQGQHSGRRVTLWKKSDSKTLEEEHIGCALEEEHMGRSLEEGNLPMHHMHMLSPLKRGSDSCTVTQVWLCLYRGGDAGKCVMQSEEAHLCASY